ncbi:MAG: Protein of unknown function (DUF3529) [Phormidesmis priestleyi Ana]|uniref:Cofactor assembly of complex C subunit B n=1 Tax=Phormidesmis priestleyi Ana TaxID=1666911 RepID=A0A0P8A245_9CYAN|nr:MAG: Protein of unknown function (DUF3529) [Phormidesmis priestleyi Ana]
MVVGLVFFIRASTKDRIEAVQFGSTQAADNLQQAVLKYFYSRAYQLPTEADGATHSTLLNGLENISQTAPVSKKKSKEPIVVNGTTLVGMVSPSVFLAVFLSVLAAVGFTCLSLVVATLFPSWGGWLLALVAASPLAGVFYWKKSNRPETVIFRVDALDMPSGSDGVQTPPNTQKWCSKLTVKGHRDELADLERAFAEPDLKEWANLERVA